MERAEKRGNPKQLKTATTRLTHYQERIAATVTHAELETTIRAADNRIREISDRIVELETRIYTQFHTQPQVPAGQHVENLNLLVTELREQQRAQVNTKSKLNRHVHETRDARNMHAYVTRLARRYDTTETLRAGLLVAAEVPDGHEVDWTDCDLVAMSETAVARRRATRKQALERRKAANQKAWTCSECATGLLSRGSETEPNLCQVCEHGPDKRAETVTQTQREFEQWKNTCLTTVDRFERAELPEAFLLSAYDNLRKSKPGHGWYYSPERDIRSYYNGWFHQYRGFRGDDNQRTRAANRWLDTNEFCNEHVEKVDQFLTFCGA